MILKNCITYNLDKFLKDSNVLLITKKSDEIIKEINKQLKDKEVTTINLALSKNFKQVKSGVDNMVSFDLKL